MPERTRISFIGSGNVAWHLAPALDNVGFSVAEVFSRDLKHAKALVNKLYQAEAYDHLDFSESPASLFIVAVSDDAIEEVSRELIIPENAILVHTSGTRPMSSLAYAATGKIGVFYPLQTFSKGKKVDFSQLPICIEAEDKTTEKLLTAMASSISKKVLKVNAEDRKALHIAAVFACNFTNHLFKIAQDILGENKLSFELLYPLIAETVQKSLDIGPKNAQTGPAKRHDLETLDTHMQYLEGDEIVQELYQRISQHIIDTYPDEDEVRRRGWLTK